MEAEAAGGASRNRSTRSRDNEREQRTRPCHTREGKETGRAGDTSHPARQARAGDTSHSSHADAEATEAGPRVVHAGGFYTPCTETGPSVSPPASPAAYAKGGVQMTQMDLWQLKSFLENDYVLEVPPETATGFNIGMLIMNATNARKHGLRMSSISGTREMKGPKWTGAQQARIRGTGDARENALEGALSSKTLYDHGTRDPTPPRRD